MLREAESDKSADSSESVSSGNQQDVHTQIKDSTAEPPLQWHRATNKELVENVEYLSKLLGHTVTAYGKDLEKQIKTLKRFR
jgi:hypothetical protein